MCIFPCLFSLMGQGVETEGRRITPVNAMNILYLQNCCYQWSQALISNIATDTAVT